MSEYPLPMKVARPVPVRTNINRLTLDVDAVHCALCGKSVKARKSTPSRVDINGRLFRWCRKCWHIKGAKNDHTAR